MPGSYPPTQTTHAQPQIEVTSVGDLSYNELQQSLGSFVYKAFNFYFKAGSNSQILKRIPFKEYDANGNAAVIPVVPAVDPYQFQTALNIDLAERNVVFDGQLTFDLLLVANELLFIIFDIEQLAAATELPNNESVFDLFKDYTDP